MILAAVAAITGAACSMTADAWVDFGRKEDGIERVESLPATDAQRLRDTIATWRDEASAKVAGASALVGADTSAAIAFLDDGGCVLSVYVAHPNEYQGLLRLSRTPR